MFSKNWLQNLARKLASKQSRPRRASTKHNLSRSAEVFEQRTLMSANALTNLSVENDASDEVSGGEPVEDGAVVGEKLDWYCTEPPLLPSTQINSSSNSEANIALWPDWDANLSQIGELIGLDSDGVRTAIQTYGMRVVSIDGWGGAVTLDWRPGRLNVSIESGRVVEAYSEGGSWIEGHFHQYDPRFLPSEIGNVDGDVAEGALPPASPALMESDDNKFAVGRAENEDQTFEPDSPEPNAEQSETAMSATPDATEFCDAADGQTDSEDSQEELTDSELLDEFSGSDWMSSI